MIIDPNFYYLIAENVFDPSGSKLLTRTDADSGEKLDQTAQQINKEYDFSEFLAGGYYICLCYLIDSPNLAGDVAIRIKIGEQEYFFEIAQVVKAFPLIEGNFAPGIYEFHPHAHWYFEVCDLLTLSDVYFGYYVNELVGEVRIVCSENAVELVWASDGEMIERMDRHPFTFFDVDCPICGQRVITHKKESNKSPRCEIIYKECPHFIGNVVDMAGGYEDGILDKFRVNYQFISGELFFENGSGDWEKPLIHIPRYDPINSYWNCTADEDSDFEDHILFLESGNIKRRSDASESLLSFDLCPLAIIDDN